MITLKVQTVNRVGITHDVIEALIGASVDIVQMEVQPHLIFLKIPSLKSGLVSAIQAIDGVRQAEQVPFLPSEARENQMDTILATISEGILSVDPSLRVRMMNKAAAEMLHVQASELIGQSLAGLWQEQTAQLQQTLTQGKETHNVSITLPLQKKGEQRFIASYLPIRPLSLEEGHGVLIVLRDMKQVQDLIQSVKKTGVLHFEDIIHHSESMKWCIEAGKRVAKSKATILLNGESGTGKELFARAIHFESLRAQGPFVPINCAAIPENLLESELFGYAEGAFTGAIKGGKSGLFELAGGGTIFLDEIAELPLHLQAKLLRVLEERMIRRVGGQHAIPIDVRIIAATNRNLAAMAAKGQFREDLYYRLQVIPIQLPPLRERKKDIPLLVRHFLSKLERQLGRPPLSLTTPALLSLESYDWPGNVRELQNVIERTVYLCPEEESEIAQVYLPSSLSGDPSFSLGPVSLKQQVENFEKRLLIQSLKACKSARQAAQQMGLSHTAVLKKIKKYQLEDLLGSP